MIYAGFSGNFFLFQREAGIKKGRLFCRRDVENMKFCSIFSRQPDGERGGLITSLLAADERVKSYGYILSIFGFIGRRVFDDRCLIFTVSCNDGGEAGEKSHQSFFAIE